MKYKNIFSKIATLAVAPSILFGCGSGEPVSADTVDLSTLPELSVGFRDGNAVLSVREVDALGNPVDSTQGLLAIPTKESCEANGLSIVNEFGEPEYHAGYTTYFDGSGALNLVCYDATGNAVTLQFPVSAERVEQIQTYP